MLQWKRDLLYGMIILLFCIANFIYAGYMDAGTIKISMAQPAPYLRMWLVILSVLSLLLVFKSLRSKDCTVQPPIFVKTSVLSIGAMIIYLLLIPRIGFLIASFLFLFFTVTLYSACMWQARPGRKILAARIFRYVLLSIVTAVLVDQVFRNVLGVILPTFSLF